MFSHDDPTGTATAWRVDARMPFHVADVPPLRRRVVDEAIRHGVGAEAVGNLALVVGELVANAVHHATPLADGRIAVTWGGDRHVVRLAVTDGGGRSQPVVVVGAPTDTTGRGLALVRDLAAEWGTVIEPGQTTVWVTIADSGF